MADAADAKTPEERAKRVVCAICKIASRKQLNTDPLAAAEFKSAILQPYAAQRMEDGCDDQPF
jgi:hypothetical protein